MLTFIISFAVAVTILAFDFGVYLEEQLSAKSAVENGEANMKVSVTSLSDVRFMSLDDAEKVLPDGHTVCGTYAMPVFYGEQKEFSYGVVTDIRTANRIFSFEFAESQAVSENKLHSAVYVSSDFSKKNGIGLGDEISLTFFDKRTVFTVYGISEKDIMNEYAVMIDVSAMTKAVGEESFFVSLLGDGFCPCSTLYIVTDESAERTAERLRSVFDNVSVTEISPETNELIGYIEILSYLVILFTFTFAFAVIYSCFYVLTEQRKDENALFYAAGAREGLLTIVSVAEMFVYWLVGCVLGVLLSKPMSSLLLWWGQYDLIRTSVHARSVAFACLVVLVATECGMLLFTLVERVKKSRIRKGKKQRRRETRKKAMDALLLIAEAVAIVCTVLLPTGTVKLALCLVSTVILMVLIFCLGTLFFEAISKRKAKKAKRVTSRYAFKNCACIVNFGHSASLISLFLCVMFGLSIMTETLVQAKDDMSGIICGDYVVLSGSFGSEEIYRDIEGVQETYRIKFDYGKTSDGHDALLFCSSSGNTFSGNLRLNELPKGSEVVVSKPYATKANVKKGDVISLRYGDVVKDLTVVGYVTVNKDVFVIDAEEWSIPLDTVVVQKTQDCESEKLYEDLVSSLALENAVVCKPNELFAKAVNEFNSYLSGIYLMMIFLAVFAVIGIADSIASAYRSRAEEFVCYRLSGMNKHNVRKMKSREATHLVLTGIALFVIWSGLTFLTVYEIGGIFGIDVSYIFRNLIRRG